MIKLLQQRGRKQADYQPWAVSKKQGVLLIIIIVVVVVIIIIIIIIIIKWNRK